MKQRAIVVAMGVCLLFGIGVGTDAKAEDITYVSFFEHFESAPVRGRADTVQYTFPYNGEGPAPFSIEAKNILAVCEKYGIKIEFALKPDVLLQLAEDFPEVIEKFKALHMPITRYGGVSHNMPAPVARMREIPGIDEMGPKEYVEAEWLFETHNLIPNWHDENGHVFPSNPNVGQPFTLDLLPVYRWKQTPENLYGGTLAIQKVLGVTPMPLFVTRFKGQQQDAVMKTAFGESIAKKALGMGSFPISYNAGNPAKYMQPGVPRQSLLQGTEEFERTVKQYIDQPDKFKIVWPDPEENQWKPENSPLKFYKKTYGVNSLEEVLNMKPPVDKIMKMYPNDVPKVPAGPKLNPQDGDWSKRLWSEAELKNLPEHLQPIILWEKRELPEYLRARQQKISKDDLLAAANYLLANRQGGMSHDGEFPSPPDYVKSGSKNLSLAESFEALVLALDFFDKQQHLPDNVTIEEILGPIDYPMSELKEEPKYDPFKHRDEWTPRELPKEYFPDREILASQGIPPSGDGPSSVSVNEAAFLNAVYETAPRLKEEGQVPAVIPVEAQRGRGPGAPRESSETQCNAAEFLYGMAEMYRILCTEGLPRPVNMSSMKIIQDQLCRYVAPSTPGWITNSAYRSGAFIWREKVSKQLLNAAWTYSPDRR